MRKWYVVSLQDPFLVGLWNAIYLGPSAKLPYFETLIATFEGIWEKLPLPETQIATSMGISRKFLLFYWKSCILWEIYKFATFSINYVKLKLFNHLLQSNWQTYIGGNILVSLDWLNLSTIFIYFFYIFQKQCTVNISSSFLLAKMC